MKSVSVYLLCILLLASCSSDDKDVDKNDALSGRSVETPAESESQEIVNVESHVLNEVAPEFEGYTIQFPGFKFIIDSVNLWSDEKILFAMNKNDVEAALDLGEIVENRRFQILQSIYDKIAVFQRYETSFTIQDEGPHCDLTDWKHGYTQWKKLNVEDFKFRSYNRLFSESDGNIDVSVNELKSAVFDHCGEYWAEHIADIESPTEYPAGIGVSKIIFKFILENDEGKQVKFVSFLNPMGC